MLAAVPVSSSILDLGCGVGRHTEPLLRLGFPVHACDPRPESVASTRDRVAELIEEGAVESTVQVTALDSIDYPEETFNWVIADRAEVYASSDDALSTLLEESRRVLAPGGWLYLTLPAPPSADDAESTASNGVAFSIYTLEALRKEAHLAEAREPTRIEVQGQPRIRALYRRVRLRCNRTRRDGNESCVPVCRGPSPAAGRFALRAVSGDSSINPPRTHGSCSV
jgi:SAM-dependent methyltransferase